MDCHAKRSDELLHIKDPALLDREVRHIMGARFPGWDEAVYHRAFSDVNALYAGRYPGYQASNAAYHDKDHTLAVLLAMARLLHGLAAEHPDVTPRLALIGLMAALLHDVGYIQEEGDPGNGAKYTAVHVDRSIAFMRGYLPQLGFSEAETADCAAMIRITDLGMEVADVPFSSEPVRLVANALGSADVLGQMADDLYVEKLPRLYEEFEVAGIDDFKSEYDLLKKTVGFYRFMRFRLEHHLGGVAGALRLHFRERHGCDRDLYAEYAHKNVEYLDHVLTAHGEAYSDLLRRRAG